MGNEAFVYEWFNLTNGKSYIGYHKGNINDGYISSSHNHDFWNDFNNSDMMWERKILAEGTKDACLQIEQRLLKEINLRNNRYYNNARGAEIIFTKDVLDKMSNSHKKRWEIMSDEKKIEHAKKISESKKGIPRILSFADPRLRKHNADHNHHDQFHELPQFRAKFAPIFFR